MIEVDARIDDDDWKEVFDYADKPMAVLQADVSCEGFTREDVAEIIAIEDGENDESEWIGVFRLNDGRFAFLTAGCDFTGWG